VLPFLDRESPADAPASGFTTLLDRLRAHAARGMSARTLVLASPLSAPTASMVLDGLATRAERLGMEVVRGELRDVASRHLLPARRSVSSTARQCLAVTPSPAHLATEVQAWLSQHQRADLVLIEAPPLLHSIDGALVARACDGLILVAERGRTERRALLEAAHRARIAGCALLGVVVHNPDPLPRWLQRFAGARTSLLAR
jgi:hypothetical protein